MPKDNLLECPFCNGKAKLKDMKKITYYVECKGCKAATGMHMNSQEAVCAWNLRNGILQKSNV